MAGRAFLGRIIVFGGLCWDSLIWGNYHLYTLITSYTNMRLALPRVIALLGVQDLAVLLVPEGRKELDKEMEATRMFRVLGLGIRLPVV